MIQQPAIILITGNMAAGKSTVAQALAERLPRSVHLRGDRFQSFCNVIHEDTRRQSIIALENKRGSLRFSGVKNRFGFDTAENSLGLLNRRFIAAPHKTSKNHKRSVHHAYHRTQRSD